MKSMTGFGSGTARFRANESEGSITVEVKSVNQRFLDLKLQLPRELAAFEAPLRGAIDGKVARGRVDVVLSRNARRMKGAIEIDEELARQYVDAWKRVQRSLGLEGSVDLAFLRGHPELLRVREPVLDAAAELAAAQKALGAAFAEFERSRRREGQNLARDMRERVVKLAKIAAGMRLHAKRGTRQAQERMEERLREILGSRVDPERLLQEAAFQAERADVSEELVRLASHVAGLRELVASREPAGRRIEFLLQEVGREVNTVASKSNDLALTALAVEAKAEIEKLREQAQNVE